MENASKALLMAGAVLIAIILISIGITIISNTKGTVDQSKIVGDTIAIQTFNSTFTKYSGTRKGSEIKQLCTDINTNKSEHQVAISYGSYSTASDVQAHVFPNKDYIVTVNIDPNTKYVASITIADAP